MRPADAKAHSRHDSLRKGRHVTDIDMLGLIDPAVSNRPDKEAMH
jgi:hypothetical protein